VDSWLKTLLDRINRINKIVKIKECYPLFAYSCLALYTVYFIAIYIM